MTFLAVLKWRCLLTIAFAPATSMGQALANMPVKDGPAPGFVLESWTVADGLPVNTITKVIQSRSGYIWLGTFDGLVRFDGARFTTFNVGNSDGLPSNRIVNLEEERDGALIVSTEINRLVRFKNGKFTALKGTIAPAQPWHRNTSATGPDGKVWMTNGSEIFVDGRLAYRTPAASIPASGVTSIAPDNEGSLWFGTVSGGLHQIKPAVFAMYGIGAGRGDNNLYSVTPANSGGIWAGSWGNNLVSKIENGRLITFGGDPQIFSTVSLHEDRQNRLWVGGVPCELPAMRCARMSSSPIHTMVRAIHEDEDGALWFGTDAGIFELRNNTWTAFTDKPGAPTGTVRAFVRTRDGALWMATSANGIMRFDHGVFSSITTREGLPSDLVRALYEDRDGFLWIGTEGKGLARIDPREWNTRNARGRVVNVRAVDGLFDDGIHTILDDAQGRIWMSTNRGIFWVPWNELTDFASKRVLRVISTGYTERHGLRNREANGGSQPAATRTPDGRLWFATQDGVAMVDPAHITGGSASPNVLIEQVIAGGAPLASGQNEIAPDRRDLRIDFTALSFLAPENIRFRYRLVPYDKDWVDAGTRRNAIYTQVPSGDYTFEATASTGGDKWSARPASMSLTVVPRFIETRTFKLIVLLAVAFIIWMAVRWRIARLRKLSRDLQQRVDERTAELRSREVLLAEKNAQLEAQADQLQELDRAKTRFFANVSHELRTPLTLTIGPLEEARSELTGNGSNAAVSRIDMALRNARRLFRLVNQILDVSKLEAGGTKLRARPGDLTEFVRGIASAFTAVAERKQITFRVEGPTHAPSVWFDPDALEKVIANLLSNAFKFTPERGGILVTVEIGDMARVRVSDSGPGIPAEHLPHIFDRFYQVDETNTRAQPGTGIGLSLARELAELHSGTIEVESGAGGGATFILSLPMGRSHLQSDQIADLDTVLNSSDGTDAADVELASIAVPDAPRAQPISDDIPTLLVVDDNADLRTYVRARFEPRYNVVEAADGADAIQRARDVIPDLVISDVMMPGTDGHAMCAALRSSPETDFIPVILLTAQAEQSQKIAGLGIGADDYIVKPFDMRELEARVENLIASRRRLRERFAGSQLAIKSSSDGLSVHDKAFVERLKAAIDANLSNPEFGVSELAKAVFQDRSHLFRRTRELLDETPSDLLRRLRLERAAILLKAGDGTVAEVAYGAGFNSVSNFCRTFRVAYGVTPSEFRTGNAVHTSPQPVR